MVSPAVYPLNDQKRAGPIKIWQDSHYANLFILKMEDIFKVINAGEFIVNFVIYGDEQVTEKETSPDCISPGPDRKSVV
jgi:hypothetical protein